MTDVVPCHLLVVDDDPGVLGPFTELFTDAGYRVTAAPSAPTTVEVARVASDMLVIDHRLDGDT